MKTIIFCALSLCTATAMAASADDTFDNGNRAFAEGTMRKPSRTTNRSSTRATTRSRSFSTLEMRTRRPVASARPC